MCPSARVPASPTSPPCDTNIGARGASRQGHPGLPRQVPWQRTRGTGRGPPVLTPRPLSRTPTQPPPDSGQHHCPMLLTLRPGLATWAPRSRSTGNRALRQGRGVQGPKVGNTLPESSLLHPPPQLPGHRSLGPRTAREQGTRATRGPRGLGSLWGRRLPDRIAHRITPGPAGKVTETAPSRGVQASPTAGVP